MIDLRTKSLADLNTIVANHVRQGATENALCREAVEEKARRGRTTLDAARTLEKIRQAAMARHLLNYKDIADASNAEWNKVRPQMTKHLGDICRDEAGRLGFMVSAIIVAKERQHDGSMDPKTLSGFLKAAESCQLFSGDGDGAVFLKEQQARVFEWGQRGAPL